MPMTYAQLATNAADATWRDRVRGAMLVAAVAIAQDSPVTALDIRRDRLARSVLANPDGWLDRFVMPVALGFMATDNDLTSSNVTDGEIDTRVAAVWNDLMP